MAARRRTISSKPRKGKRGAGDQYGRTTMYRVLDNGHTDAVQVYINKRQGIAIEPDGWSPPAWEGARIHQLHDLFRTREEAVEKSGKLFVGYRSKYDDEVEEVRLRFYRGQLQVLDTAGKPERYGTSKVFARLDDAFQHVYKVKEDELKVKRKALAALEASFAKLKKEYERALKVASKIPRRKSDSLFTYVAEEQAKATKVLKEKRAARAAKYPPKPKPERLKGNLPKSLEHLEEEA